MEFNSTGLDGSARTILIVDDMEANRAVLCRRMERFGYGVLSVDSGAAALSIVAHSVPDIILLDYMMPQMNGIEVLRTLRANPATQDVPVIMVTARAESEATVEALEAGADDYVTKPIDFEVLKARVEAQLSKRTDSTDLRRANAALDERVTVRSMALADIEFELKEEIRRRKELESQIGKLTVQPADRISSDPSLEPLMEKIVLQFDAVFTAITTGRTPNLAQMAELKANIEEARRLAAG